MSLHRYTFDPDSGLLVDRNGETLGRVVSLTIDDAPLGGRGVKASSLTNGSSVKEETEKDGTVVRDGGVGEGRRERPTPTQREREAIQRVWDYWLSISEKKQRIDNKRERIIRDALRLVGEDATKQALLGLTRSPHHRGENEQRKTYMEIRYALKGRGDESDDERIEKAISWAATYAPNTAHVDPDKVERWLDEVRQYRARRVRNPDAITGRDRAVVAYQALRDVGFDVVALDAAPWARLTR